MTNTLDFREPIPCPVPFPECGPDGCSKCGGTGEYTPAHPDQPTKGQLALNGARLALAQLAVDAETLLNAWEEREKLLDRATGGAIERLEAQVSRREIRRCRQELQGLLRIWEIK